MNRTDTHHLFTSQPKFRDEASRSHWLDVPREGFTDRINREELARMKRSREAKGVSSTFIVGHAGRSK